MRLCDRQAASDRLSRPATFSPIVVIAVLAILTFLLGGIRLFRRAAVAGLSASSSVRSSVPTILDLRALSNAHCFVNFATAVDFTGAKTCFFPFASWVQAMGLSELANGNISFPCSDTFYQTCQQVGQQTTRLVCNDPQNRSRTVRQCDIVYNLDAGPTADAVVLSHIGINSFLLEPANLKALLWPPERSGRSQVWAMQVMYESTGYYPAGGDSSIVASFNYTFGSARHMGLNRFKMSYLPDWTSLLVPYNATRRAEAAARVDARAPVVWVASNCISRSNREELVRALMKVLDIDSFGSCLNNRNAGDFGMRADGSNWRESLSSKHSLLEAYKFTLVLENTIEPSYVTEKIFDAWEAGSVPLYLGAPDIADFAIAPGAYIDLRNRSAIEIANLVRQLDVDDAAYAELHAWRLLPAEVLLDSPLARRIAESAHSGNDYDDILCDICAAIPATIGG